MSELAQAHILGQERLRALAASGITAVWQALRGHDEKDVPEFLAAVVPFVLALQRQSVALTNAYVARATNIQPAPLDIAELVGAGVRAGSPPEEVYKRPFRTVWTALAAGSVLEDALHAGLARAASTGEMDVQLSSRATLQAAQNANPRIRGYQRVPDGGACSYCRALAGAFVKSADAMPLHNRCGCTLEPVLNEAIHASPLPESVAVHEHGELGAVIGDPAHSFTSL